MITMRLIKKKIKRVKFYLGVILLMNASCSLGQGVENIDSILFNIESISWPHHLKKTENLYSEELIKLTNSKNGNLRFLGYLETLRKYIPRSRLKYIKNHILIDYEEVTINIANSPVGIPRKTDSISNLFIQFYDSANINIDWSDSEKRKLEKIRINKYGLSDLTIKNLSYGKQNYKIVKNRLREGKNIKRGIDFLTRSKFEEKEDCEIVIKYIEKCPRNVYRYCPIPLCRNHSIVEFLI